MINANYTSYIHIQILSILTKQKQYTETTGSSVRFQASTAKSIKMDVFWDVAPCSSVNTDRRFRANDGGSLLFIGGHDIVVGKFESDE
jgi:hypothetical protein